MCTDSRVCCRWVVDYLPLQSSNYGLTGCVLPLLSKDLEGAQFLGCALEHTQLYTTSLAPRPCPDASLKPQDEHGKPLLTLGEKRSSEGCMRSASADGIATNE